MVRECQTEEEILLDKFNDSLYNIAECNADIDTCDDGMHGNSVVDLTTADNETDDGGTEFKWNRE